ncbi:MAG: hypothetical protein OXE17_09775 [Chloroflexi bacterium]|nr:hypothetical protein [Chloroflexota bacterium]
MFALPLSLLYLYYAVSSEPSPRPAADPGVSATIGDTGVTVEIFLVNSMLAVSLVAWGILFSISSLFRTPRGLYQDYVFTSRIKWMMRIGAANALFRGAFWGLTTFVLILLGSLASLDVIGVFLGPEIEAILDERKSSLVPGIVLLAAVYGVIVGLGYIFCYLLNGFAAVNTHRNNEPNPIKAGGVSITSKPICLAIGIPVTLALLLLAPPYWKRGLLDAWEMLSPVRSFFRHPLRGATREYHENQVLKRLYPEIFGEPDQ